MDHIRMPELGQTIREKYAIEGKLGEGGMGVVFRARDTHTNEHVAMKVLRSEMLHERENLARFDRESRAVGQLKGPHIARMLDVDLTESGLPFIILELLDGHDLSAEIELRSHIEADEAVDYVLQACTAMAEAHALGIIHRDLKPSNLFVCDSGGTRIIKVLDFGISKIVSDDDARVTLAQAAVGTPLYMSPEQVRSANVGASTDVWSLGVILYELLVGRPPFVGSATVAAAAIISDDPLPPTRIRRDLPSGLEHVVLTALQKDEKKRYPDVEAFARALRPFAPGPISGDRLMTLQREAEKNRLIAGTPGAPESPTLVGRSRHPKVPRATVPKPGRARRGLLFAAAAIPVFLAAAAVAGVSYRARAAARAAEKGPTPATPLLSPAQLENSSGKPAYP